LNQQPVPALRNIETIPITDNGKDYILLRDPSGFSEKVLAVSPEVLPILALFDGQHSLDEMAEEISKAIGEPFPAENLKQLADTMEDALFLMSKSFFKEQKELQERFRLSKIRQPVMAGNGYPAEVPALKELLEHYLNSPDPEDFEPEKPEKSLPTGLLLPHIDLVRGGPSYGRCYREFSKLTGAFDEKPLLIVIIGVAHGGALSPIVIADKDFDTPFGRFMLDGRAKALAHARLGDKPFDELWVHKNEHSIELQIIWLQHILKDREVTFLPILAGSFSAGKSGNPADNNEVKNTIETLQQIENSHDGNVLWVASVDFAHVGPRFGDIDPVEKSFLSQIARRDLEALEALRNTDARKWWESILKDDNERRVCGFYATYLFLELVKGSKGFICDYQQAVSNEKDQMVSFASAIFTAN